MTKYMILADDPDGHPVIIRKFKNENDAIIFVSDMKNLSRYGCMSIRRRQEDGSCYIWHSDTKVWEQEEKPNDESV